MKIGQYEIDGKWIGIGAIVLVVIIVLVYLSWPAKKPVDTTAIMNQAMEAAKAPLQQQIKDKEAQIKDYQNRLTISDSKYKALVQNYITLQKEKENVKAPTTNKELRDRFTAAGFPPLSSK